MVKTDIKRSGIARKGPFWGIFLMFFLFCFTLGAAEHVDRIVMVVNDEVVTQREFDRMFEPIRENLEWHFEGAELQERLREAEQGVREHLINAKLAISLARDRGLSIDEQELENRISTIRDSYYETEQEFLMALRARGTNLTEFRREIREQMLAQKLVEQEVASNIIVTPGDIKQAYDENIHEMRAPEQVLLRTIMVRKHPDISEEELNARIEDIRTLAKDTGNFESLARERSEGPYAEEGGLMGYVARGQTVPAIDRVVFALEEGKVSEVVESPIGLHIFLVEEKFEERTLELHEVSDFLREQIFMRKFQEELAAYLEEQRQQAHITFN